MPTWAAIGTPEHLQEYSGSIGVPGNFEDVNAHLGTDRTTWGNLQEYSGSIGIPGNFEGGVAFPGSPRSTRESIGKLGFYLKYQVTLSAGMPTWAATGIPENLQE